MIYVCSPYTHSSKAVMDHRERCVAEYVAFLHTKGEKAFSPIVHNAPLLRAGTGLMYGIQHWQSFDLHMLEKSDLVHVYQLPGWAESSGIEIEITHSSVKALPLFYVQPLIELFPHHAHLVV